MAFAVSRRNRTHLFWALALLVVVVGFLTSSVPTSSAQAQDNAAAAPQGGGENAGGGDGGAAPAGQQKNALIWLFESLGILYIVVFLGLSFIFVALVIMNMLTARRESMCPVHLIQGFEACLNEQKYQEAYEMAKADESVLGNVLSAGLAKLSSGYDHAVEAMQEVGEEENMKLEHRLSYINLIAQIAPMVGLFGTVHGMIDSFYVIANGGGTPDPNKLADGIAKALVTTLIGLLIAMPAMAVFRVMFNRVQRMTLEIGITSEGLMSRFQTAGVPKGATTPKA